MVRGKIAPVRGDCSARKPGDGPAALSHCTSDESDDFIAIIAYIACNRPTEAPLSTLMVRNVDPTLKEKLRVRAAQHGRSMEAELRHILSDALTDEKRPKVNLAEAIRRRFARIGGVELEPHPPTQIGEPPSFRR